MAGAVTLLDKYLNGNELIWDADGNLDASTLDTGDYFVLGGVRFYSFTSALTENSTATSAPAGSYAFTSNATGKNKIFYSDGAAWQAASNPITGVQYAEATISSAAITATTAGNLGHAAGVEVVAAPGAGKAIEFMSALVIYDFGVAAYGDGGNVGVKYTGSDLVSGVVSNANSLAAAGDKVALLLAAVPTNNQALVNTGLSLTAATAFSQPGTAVGVARIKIAYRTHSTGL